MEQASKQRVWKTRDVDSQDAGQTPKTWTQAMDAPRTTQDGRRAGQLLRHRCTASAWCAPRATDAGGAGEGRRQRSLTRHDAPVGDQLAGPSTLTCDGRPSSTLPAPRPALLDRPPAPTA